MEVVGGPDGANVDQANVVVPTSTSAQQAALSTSDILKHQLVGGIVDEEGGEVVDVVRVGDPHHHQQHHRHH